jgi:uncharacterized oxidoreductase
MNPTGNTILITGGGSGIGRGLAEAFHKAGNQVIISGRRRQMLDQAAAENPGIKSAVFDIENPSSIRDLAAQMARDFPKLNVLVNNAGIMRHENLQSQQLADAESTVTTNLLGPIRLTSALLPLLKRQAKSTVMMVTSGLAFMPMAATPTYCATKAAIHSYTQSLRWQLRGTTTEVIELIPPYVQTHLTGPQQAQDPRAMPLADFIAEVMQILKGNPSAAEICVERVKAFRFAAESGKFDSIFKGLNEAPH